MIGSFRQEWAKVLWGRFSIIPFCQKMISSRFQIAHFNSPWTTYSRMSPDRNAAWENWSGKCHRSKLMRIKISLRSFEPSCSRNILHASSSFNDRFTSKSESWTTRWEESPPSVPKTKVFPSTSLLFEGISRSWPRAAFALKRTFKILFYGMFSLP